MIAAKILVVLAATMTLPEAKLFGDHICQMEVLEPRIVLGRELQNRTVRTYKWCLSVPPRCSFYTYKLVNETRPMTINVTKRVERCCDGFTELNHACVNLHCLNCQNGVCVRGSCLCQSGWEGRYCDFPVTTTTTTTAASATSTAVAVADVATLEEGSGTPQITTTQAPSIDLQQVLGEDRMPSVVDVKSTTFVVPLVLDRPGPVDTRGLSDEMAETPSSLEDTNGGTKFASVLDNKHLIYSICAVALATFFILVVVVTLYAVKNKKKVDGGQETQAGTMPVYATNVFHSPLPELPTFDNPTYLAATPSFACQKTPNTEIHEFNVMFSQPIKSFGGRQYLYDHPPSTGSYRASSEIDALSHYNLSQREPVYDEIPCGSPPLDSIDANCLYVNSCTRTKF